MGQNATLFHSFIRLEHIGVLTTYSDEGVVTHVQTLNWINEVFRHSHLERNFLLLIPFDLSDVKYLFLRSFVSLNEACLLFGYLSA